MAKALRTITDLTPDPANVNKGTERGHYVLDWSLTELGAGRSILADADGVVIAGNKTLEAAADHQLPIRVIPTDGKELVVVQRTDLRLTGKGKERDKARQLAIADNRASEVGYSADIETLLAHAQSGVDLSPLYRGDELDALLADLTPEEEIKPGAGGDDFDATPEETQTRVQYGDLWQLGEHRLLCGDSTKAEDVARLMGDEKTPLTVTDPPYNIAQDTEVYGQSASKSLKNLAEAEWDFNFTPETFLNATLSFHQKDCWVYVFTAHHLFGQIVDWMNTNHDKSSFGVWCKPNPMPSLAKNTWTFATEIVCIGKSGKPIFNYPDGEHCLNWWPINKSSDGTHPTQKPVELIAHIVSKCSSVGDPVTDFFGGSGSTLIACERTNRKARVIEIEPKYVNVILSRWEAETGKEAKLLERLDG